MTLPTTIQAPGTPYKWTNTGSIWGDIRALFYGAVGKITNDAEYQDWKKTLPPPTPMPAPAAPQTSAEMVSWTPEQAAAAYLEKFKDWQKIAIPELPGEPADNTWLWIGLAVAGVSAWVLFGGHRR